MKTKIKEYVRRGSYSKLAEFARKLDFNCNEITFADCAPSSNPKRDGWYDLSSYFEGYSNFDRIRALRHYICKEIWYRLSTVGGRHRIYVKYHRYTYYLISHAYAHQGWQYFGMSHDKKELDKMAEELWCGSGIENETYLKNYRIVGKSVAEKKYHVAFSEI